MFSPPMDELDYITTTTETYGFIGLCFLSFISFWVLFLTSWKLSRGLKVFAGFEEYQKADWCSRINSTIHALVIFPAMLVLTYHETPQDTEHLIPAFFCFCAGYFTQDLLVILVWQVPYWTQFATHHVVAMLPYYVYLLSDCKIGTDTLAYFLVVEMSTLPLNVQAFLEQTGLGESWMHRWSFYITYISWLIVRVLLPIDVLRILWTKYILGPHVYPCMMPGIVCAHIIAFFCILIFFAVLTPDLVRRWKKKSPEAASGRASLDSVKVGSDVDDDRVDFRSPLVGTRGEVPVNPMAAQLRNWENNVRQETLGEPWTYPPNAHILYDSSSLR